MELRHLQALEAVLATGSFTAAAAARHVSQPALWAQIRELEAELGLTLFVRAGRGVAPTAACLALRPRLELALGDVRDFRRIATEIRDGWEAPARIGCSPTHVARFLAGCIRELVEREPRTPFPVVVPITTGTAVETLAAGRIDLLAEPRADRAGKNAAPLYPMHVVALGPAARSDGEVDVRALDGAAIATMPGDSLVRRMLEEAAARARVALRVVYESRDANALFALAREGLCTAVLHDEMLDDDRAREARRLVSGRRALVAPIWLTWRRDDALSPAARALRDVMLRRAEGARPAKRRRAAAPSVARR